MISQSLFPKLSLLFYSNLLLSQLTDLTVISYLPPKTHNPLFFSYYPAESHEYNIFLWHPLEAQTHSVVLILPRTCKSFDSTEWL